MFSRTLFSVLFALSLAMPATAKSVFYVCDLDTKRAMNWVSPTMGIVFDAAKGSSVVDGLTLHYLGGPVAARARKRDDIVRLTWTISGAEDVKKHTVARFAYEARLNVKTNVVSVVAKPVGYPQRFSAKGKCAIHRSAKGFPRLRR